MSLKKLESQICYEYKDIDLLELALVHKSSNNKNNNERLEFLGDSILNLVISDYLYSNFTQSINSPSCVTLFKLQELNGIGLLEVNSHLSATVVDRILGGKGSTNPEDRYKKTPVNATIPRPIIGLRKIQPIKTNKKINIARYWLAVRVPLFATLTLSFLMEESIIF